MAATMLDLLGFVSQHSAVVFALRLMLVAELRSTQVVTSVLALLLNAKQVTLARDPELLL